MKELVASINGETVGTLQDENGFWVFQYAPAWLENPRAFPISPALPLAPGRYLDAGTTRPVQWFFDNLLPEEAARELLAKDAQLDFEDAWGLLQRYGAESAGAITLLPPDAAMAESGVTPLGDMALQARIDDMPRRALSADSPKRMSLAGAQHKLAVSLIDGELHEPYGGACSTHILKPDSKAEGFPHTAINECFCMKLAEALRLPVPNAFIRYVPSPVYFVERFDRRATMNGLERRHLMDALQLLSLDRRLKYRKANSATLKEAIDKCRSLAKARMEVFRWTVFNVLIGNGDAHMKNISFFIEAKGITLADFYDLVSTVVYCTPQYDQRGPYWPDVELSMPIGSAKFFADISRSDLIQFAAEIDIKRSAAHRMIDELVNGIIPSAQKVHASLEHTASAGEKRLLDAIIHLPIREMVARLQRE